MADIKQSIKPIVIGVFVTLLTIVAYLAFALFDAGVSLNYSRISNEGLASSRERLSNLLMSEWQNLSEEQVLFKLKMIDAKLASVEPAAIKREKDEPLIWYGQIRFEFREGKLSAIN